MDITYKALFCAFVIVGSAISAQSVFDGDAMIFAMCLNVLGLYFMAREVKEDLGTGGEEWRNQTVRLTSDHVFMA